VPLRDWHYPVGFFDGAAQGHLCGAGCRIWINQHHYYNLWMSLEDCTNNCSEIIALWLCLHWAKQLGITDIRIMGDSKVVIDWFNHTADLHSILLLHWCRTIRTIQSHFSCVTVQHTYRENNMIADRLSKRGLGGQVGLLQFEELMGTTVIRRGHIMLFWSIWTLVDRFCLC